MDSTKPEPSVFDAECSARHALELIASKLADYNVIDYAGKVDSMIARLPEIVRGKDFTDQMSRFIPLQIHERTLLKEKFQVVLAQDVAGLLTKATSAVS